MSDNLFVRGIVGTLLRRNIDTSGREEDVDDEWRRVGDEIGSVDIRTDFDTGVVERVTFRLNKRGEFGNDWFNR